MKRNTDEVLESPAKNIYHKNTGIQTEQPCKKDLGAFTYDVRWFWGISDLPTYPHQILYYISLFSKIRCSLTYLPT